MPNHITNILEIKSKKYKEIIKKITTRGKLDFNKIAKMPKELRGVASPPKIVSEDQYKKAVTDFKKAKKNTSGYVSGLPLTAKLQQEYLKKFGAQDWYDWSIKNWGTKWNTYDCSIKKNTIKFDTAWSVPKAIFKKLGELFPDVRFEGKWADEDTGSNTGSFHIKDGELTMFYCESHSQAAYNNYFSINPGEKKDYVLHKGEYIHVDSLPATWGEEPKVLEI